jgi:hypothetical protein
VFLKNIGIKTLKWLCLFLSDCLKKKPKYQQYGNMQKLLQSLNKTRHQITHSDNPPHSQQDGHKTYGKNEWLSPAAEYRLKQFIQNPSRKLRYGTTKKDVGEIKPFENRMGMHKQSTTKDATGRHG